MRNSAGWETRKKFPISCHVEKAVGEKKEHCKWIEWCHWNWIYSIQIPSAHISTVLRKSQAETSKSIWKKERGKLQIETCIISTCSGQLVDFGNVFWKWQKNLYSASWTQLTVAELNFELDPEIHYSWWTLKSIFGCTVDFRCLGAVCSHCCNSNSRKRDSGISVSLFFCRWKE